MAKANETVLEIDLNALAHNYQYIRAKIDADVQLMAVVKAMGYGSDAVSVAQKLVALGVDYLAVAYVREGVALRQAGITIPILVMHPQKAHFDELIENCLEPALYNQKILNEFGDTLIKKGLKNYPVQIKINTGLNRLGFHVDELPEVHWYLQNFDVKAIFRT